jgi:nucleoside-diphosphate-sugar epimerase
MVESTKPTVLITGVSGYLGSHVALEFLKDGTYTVKGTVRDTKNLSKIEPLRKAFGEHFELLTLVEADLNSKDSLLAAIKGADFVVHTASPFPLQPPKTEEELINPAVNGTLAVMEACHINKIKRVVITSSIAAIMYCKSETRPKNGVYNETNWSDPIGDHISAYCKSKTLAEKAAWDFQKKIADSHNIEIVTINPGLILGPAFVSAGFSSGDLLISLINSKYPGLPRTSLPVVDVRECAVAHLEALKRPEAANKRFILANKSAWLKDLAEILKTEFQPQGY